MGFSPSGGIEFCEGADITFENTSEDGFEYFVIEWNDGKIDTIHDYSDAKHTYAIPDSLLCQGDRLITVCFRGILTCAGGVTCASGAYNFTLKVRPLANILIPPEHCVNSSVAFREGACNETAYLWDFGDGAGSSDPNPSHVYTASGNYPVSLTATNSCGTDVVTTLISVVDFPDAQVAWTPQLDSVCLGQIISFSDVTSLQSRTDWSIIPNDTSRWMFTDTLMGPKSDSIAILFKAVGTYTVRLTATNACGTDRWEEQITVLNAPAAQVAPGPILCESNAVYNPSATYTNQSQITAYAWNFAGGSPATSTLAIPPGVSYPGPGIYPVQLSISSICGVTTQTTVVTIDTLPSITLPVVPGYYCSGSGPDTLSALPSGGDWAGAGIVGDSIFDPASVPPGTYMLSYTYQSGACTAVESLSVTVVESEMVTVGDLVICQDTGLVQLAANPLGGTWGGTGIVQPTGVFDPAVSGAGTFYPMYSYSDSNGCLIERQAMVEVQPLPVVNMLDTAILCDQDINVLLADVVSLVATPPGGMAVWQINQQPVSDTINGSGLSGLLMVDLDYVSGVCTVSDSGIIAVIPPPALVIGGDTTVCIYDSLFQLQSNLQGNWSGPGADPMSGLVNLYTAGPGSHAYNYVYEGGTSCERRDTLLLTINDPGLMLEAGPDVSLCFGQSNTYTFSGYSPTGGLWSGPGVTDPLAGAVDLTQLSSDTSYTYTYCLEDTQLTGCLACDRRRLIVHSLPDAGFDLSGLACLDVPFSVIADTCVSENTYAWNFGNGQTAQGCQQVYTYSIQDDYTLSLQVTSVFGCVTASNLTVHVTAPPIASFDLLADEGCAPFSLQVQNFSSGEIDQQYWLIGGDTISGPDPGPVVFDGITQDTVFLIQLYVGNGCALLVDRAEVLVHPYPIVDFGFSVDEGCSPLTIDFGNTTTGNPETWFWDLGNDTVSTDSIPPPQEYTTPHDSISVYTIQLISANSCGADTLRQDLVVYPPDVTAFIQMDTLAGCQPLSLRPQSFSTAGAIITWKVIGPDGQVTGSSDFAPLFVLDQPGEHTVILTASRCGSDFDTAYIRVLPAPVVDFQVPPVICEGEEISLVNTSLNVGDILWDLGNGQQSAAFSPYVTYDSPGTYTISLTARSLVNDCPAVRTKTITVRPKPGIAIDDGPVSGCPPLLVNFENNGDPNLSYVWQFMDGTPQSYDAAPSHVFSTSGQFGVTVYAFDNAGCISDTAIIPVILFDVPVSRFVIPEERRCARYDSILAENTSMGASGYAWLINGLPGTLDPLAVLPDTPGLYVIDLIAENGFGCRDTTSQVIEVQASPVAAFMADPFFGCAPLEVAFTNQSSFSTGYTWEFGEGNAAVLVNPTFIYPVDGTFEVLLTAYHTNGCPQDTASVTIDVWPVPEAAFTFTKAMTCGVPMEVQTDNLSTGALDFSWDFGDGGASILAEPIHAYQAADDYVITMIATNTFLCRDTAMAAVEIYEQPVADFALQATQFCQRDTIVLTHTSLHGNQFHWYLDGQLIAEATSHSFIAEQIGTHSLTLIVEYNSFCRDTFTLPEAFEVFLSPTADFTYQADLDAQIIGDVAFANQSLQFDRVLWDFGDGQSATANDPVHEYDLNRSIEVQLYAFQDNMGLFTCVDSIRKGVDPEWITTFFAPNAFSPAYGADGVRIFQPTGTGLEDYMISVYSPWGQRVWHSTVLVDGRPGEGWNGRLDNEGEELPQGAFTWLAEVGFVNGVRRIFKGSVTLLR